MVNDILLDDRELIFLNAIKDKEDNTKLIEVLFSQILFNDYYNCTILNKEYKISPCAYLSINNQIKVKGRGFQDLNNNLRVEIYNQVLNSKRLKNKKALVIVIDNVVKAIMMGGDDERSYRYVKTIDLINKVLLLCRDRELECSFVSGSYDDYISIVRYEITNMFNFKYNCAFDIISSISGHSSIKVTPIIFTKSSEAQLDESLLIEHKGFPLSRLEKEFDKVIASYDKYFKKIPKLNNDIINDKDIFISSICSKVGLNKRAANYIISNFKGETKMDLLNFLSDLEFKGNHGENKESILGKFLNFI